jgi:hypothetical protein
MAFHSGLERPGRMELLSTDFKVPESAVEGRQLGTLAQNGYVGCTAAMLAAIVLDSPNHDAPDAPSLMCGIHREHAEIPSLRATDLDVNGSNNAPGMVIGYKEAFLLHHGPHSFDVRAHAMKNVSIANATLVTETIDEMSLGLARRMRNFTSVSGCWSREHIVCGADESPIEK